MATSLDGAPRMNAWPPVGLTRPRSILIDVLLPAPLGPRKPKISPRLTVKDRPLTATRDPNTLRRFRVSMAHEGDVFIRPLRESSYHLAELARGTASPELP